MIDGNQEIDPTPNRKSFDVISDIGSDTKDKGVNLFQSNLTDALERYLVHYPGERGRFQREKDKVNSITNVYAESLFEVTNVLGVKDFRLELDEIKRDLPGTPFGTTNFAYVGKDPEGNLILVINADLFFDQAKRWGYSPVIEKGVVKEIRETVAEEVAHIYVDKKYPKTSLRTGAANDTNWNEYSNDRGENFADGFAKRYMEYKDLSDKQPGSKSTLSNLSRLNQFIKNLTKTT